MYILFSFITLILIVNLQLSQCFNSIVRFPLKLKSTNTIQNRLSMMAEFDYKSFKKDVEGKLTKSLESVSNNFNT